MDRCTPRRREVSVSKGTGGIDGSEEVRVTSSREAEICLLYIPLNRDLFWSCEAVPVPVICRYKLSRLLTRWITAEVGRGGGEGGRGGGEEYASSNSLIRRGNTLKFLEWGKQENLKCKTLTGGCDCLGSRLTHQTLQFLRQHSKSSWRCPLPRKVAPPASAPLHSSPGKQRTRLAPAGG